MNPSIFKAYDIRGRSPEDLDASDALRIGKAIGVRFAPKRVVVGHDMRGTSPMLEDALVEGLRSQGADVARIGLCSTPMFNYAIAEADGAYDLGVMVTASHNPAHDNGMKITLGDNLPVGMGSGMESLRDLALADMPMPDAAKRGGESEDPGVLERYVEAMWEFSGLQGDFEGWRISIDAGNGMDGHVLPRLARKLKHADIRELYWPLDGNFPNHEANPLKVETLEDLIADVKKSGAAFGVAFDGDGDRVGFVDENGTPIPGDILTALFAQEILKDKPGGLVLYDLRSSWSVREAVEEAGGTAKMCKVGHANIKRQMREEGAVFAGELSMHFYFQELKGCESGDLAMLLLIRMLQRERKSLSQIWKPLLRYSHSGEINFKVSDPKAKIEEIANKYKLLAKDVSTLDGVRIEFDDWWFNLRASNTEPLLRLNLEAKTPEEMERHKEELAALIGA
ncbi:phosphomannomutase/phosphoglucomutase [Candidatus Uhrbacteria bacterium]|nr:phosphomannomutase/phosphoglucomutase [Candidatus Uhrbacteria bacterium]